MAPVEDNKTTKKIFRRKETKLLIKLWGSGKVQSLFKDKLRHGKIWRSIAGVMQKRNFLRTGTECKNRIRNLKTKFKKETPSSGKELILSFSYCTLLNLFQF